jgi:hypothetical protein
MEELKEDELAKHDGVPLDKVMQLKTSKIMAGLNEGRLSIPLLQFRLYGESI